MVREPAMGIFVIQMRGIEERYQHVDVEQRDPHS
jgi:hypothetical protein